MKSIKPGRGPSGMNFIGSVVSIVFGLFWTVMAATMTRGAGIIGVVFPLFGILFIVLGIAQAVYHFKNATSKERFSSFDIVDSWEEEDPLNRLASRDTDNSQDESEETGTPEDREAPFSYCPYCGGKLEQAYRFCPFCGSRL